MSTKQQFLPTRMQLWLLLLWQQHRYTVTVEPGVESSGWFHMSLILLPCMYHC